MIFFFSFQGFDTFKGFFPGFSLQLNKGLSNTFLNSHSCGRATCSHAGELVWAVSTGAAPSLKGQAAKPSVSSEMNLGFPRQDFREEKRMGALKGDEEKNFW